MGKEKTVVQNDQTATQTKTASPEQQAIDKLDLERRQAQQGSLLQNDQYGLNLSNAFLQGKDLPGYFQQLPYGISPGVTNNLVNQSLSDLNVQLAKSGAGTMLESGASQAIGARTAGDIRQSAEQFNLGQLLNLLNLSIGAPAQIQQPMNTAANTFSGRLAGLQGSTYSGQSTNTTLGMNPFLKSFQQSAGQTLGGPKFSTGPFSFGG